MKLINTIIVLSLLSCSNQHDFFYGVWEIGDEKGKSQFVISKENKLTWNVSESSIIDNESFIIEEDTKGNMTIFIPDSSLNAATRLKLIKQDNQTVFIINYKCHINKEMIDEVALAKRNVNQSDNIALPKNQEIILPINYLGEFYLIYSEHTDEVFSKIELNRNGVGEGGCPDFKQLFNANRTFRFENSNQVLNIINPKKYGELDLNLNLLNGYENDDLVIIQFGFNQSRRENWIENIGLRIKEDQNIEHFECVSIKDLKERYDL